MIKGTELHPAALWGAVSTMLAGFGRPAAALPHPHQSDLSPVADQQALPSGFAVKPQRFGLGEMSSSRCQQDSASGHYLSKPLKATSCSASRVPFCCLSSFSCFLCFLLLIYILIYIHFVHWLPWSSSSFVGFCDSFRLLLDLTQSFCLLATPFSEADVTSTCLVALSHNCPVVMSNKCKSWCFSSPRFCSMLSYFIAPNFANSLQLVL